MQQLKIGRKSCFGEIPNSIEKSNLDSGSLDCGFYSNPLLNCKQGPDLFLLLFQILINNAERLCYECTPPEILIFIRIYFTCLCMKNCVIDLALFIMMI